MTVRSLGIVIAISIAACFVPRLASADLLINSKTGLKLGQTVATGRGAWWKAYSKVHGSTLADYVRFVKFIAQLEKEGLDRRPQVPGTASTPAVAGQVALALVGEASLGFGNGGYVAGLGGPRIGRAMSERAILFGQVLAGLVHTEDGSAFSIQPGGGLYFIPGENTPAIALQLDFPIDMYGWGHTNGLRISAGVIFGF